MIVSSHKCLSYKFKFENSLVDLLSGRFQQFYMRWQMDLYCMAVIFKKTENSLFYYIKHMLLQWKLDKQRTKTSQSSWNLGVSSVSHELWQSTTHFLYFHDQNLIWINYSLFMHQQPDLVLIKRYKMMALRHRWGHYNGSLRYLSKSA